MGKEYTIQEALKLAIQAEKDSMDFYRKAAKNSTDERAVKLFTFLATEEAGHLKSFFDHYRGKELGTLDDVMGAPPNRELPAIKALLASVGTGTTEKEAMEIALREEELTISTFTSLAMNIIDPLVKGVFDRVIKETRGHYDMIADEYSRLMKMVDRTDQDTFVRE
ncbi:MAG: ferritin family protein [Desulfuromonadia bacterium]